MNSQSNLEVDDTSLIKSRMGDISVIQPPQQQAKTYVKMPLPEQVKE
jgi:hypothetical protein